MAGNREFMYRKLHSLLGVIPVGLFLIIHLSVNYFATYGAESYNSATHFMESLPFRYILEILFIFLPLLFHAIYGLYIAFQAKHNTATYGYLRNWMFRLQRTTGVFTVIFLAWHIWETRIAAALGATVDFNMMVEIVSNPFILAFYIVGIASATFHFANGLWSFFVTWGITVSPRSQQISTFVTVGVFVVLTYIGISSILAFI
jgi:succinate dehydrogenase / fumarate reductase cytochrome b subunit